VRPLRFVEAVIDRHARALFHVAIDAETSENQVAGLEGAKLERGRFVRPAGIRVSRFGTRIWGVWS